MCHFGTLFEPKTSEKQLLEGFSTLPFCLEQGINLPVRNMPFRHQEEENILIIRDKESRQR
jgi:hypothetical protein